MNERIVSFLKTNEKNERFKIVSDCLHFMDQSDLEQTIFKSFVRPNLKNYLFSKRTIFLNKLLKKNSFFTKPTILRHERSHWLKDLIDQSFS